jgi:hypothetical protein
MEALKQLAFWHWWVFAAILLGLEMLSPAAFFLWLSVGAAVVGGLLYLFPGIGWEWQLLIFSVLSVISIVLWRMRLRSHPTPTERPTLNRRGEQYTGRLFTLDQPIVNGEGKLHVDDTMWAVTGPDCPAGSRVRVTGVDGVRLKLELS